MRVRDDVVVLAGLWTGVLAVDTCVVGVFGAGSGAGGECSGMAVRSAYVLSSGRMAERCAQRSGVWEVAGSIFFAAREQVGAESGSRSRVDRRWLSWEQKVGAGVGSIDGDGLEWWETSGSMGAGVGVGCVDRRWLSWEQKVGAWELRSGGWVDRR